MYVMVDRGRQLVWPTVLFRIIFYCESQYKSNESKFVSAKYLLLIQFQFRLQREYAVNVRRIMKKVSLGLIWRRLIGRCG